MVAQPENKQGIFMKNTSKGLIVALIAIMLVPTLAQAQVPGYQVPGQSGGWFYDAILWTYHAAKTYWTVAIGR